MSVLTRIVSASVIVGLLLALSGCATLFAEKKPEVSLGSDPQGAKVYVNGDLVGQTPVKIRLAANKDYTIEFRKDAYQTKTYMLGKQVGGGWIVLDILAGFWPIVIDLATGNWYELDTNNVKVVLEK